MYKTVTKIEAVKEDSPVNSYQIYNDEHPYDIMGNKVEWGIPGLKIYKGKKYLKK